MADEQFLELIHNAAVATVALAMLSADRRDWEALRGDCTPSGHIAAHGISPEVVKR